MFSIQQDTPSTHTRRKNLACVLRHVIPCGGEVKGGGGIIPRILKCTVDGVGSVTSNPLTCGKINQFRFNFKVGGSQSLSDLSGEEDIL